jgi:hypothetical protein
MAAFVADGVCPRAVGMLTCCSSEPAAACVGLSRICGAAVGTRLNLITQGLTLSPSLSPTMQHGGSHRAAVGRSTLCRGFGVM